MANNQTTNEKDILGRPYTGGDSCHKCDYNFPCWGDRSQCQRGFGVRKMPAEIPTTNFHARLVERRVNEILGGDATIREIVVLMTEMGWTPPTQTRQPDAAAVRDAEDAETHG